MAASGQNSWPSPGRIPWPLSRDVSVGAQADRLNAWIGHLDLGPVTLVGHDLGGGVAHIAAVRRADLCAGLMITNVIGFDSWPVPSVKAMRAAAPLVSRLPAVALSPAFRRSRCRTACRR